MLTFTLNLFSRSAQVLIKIVKQLFFTQALLDFITYSETVYSHPIHILSLAVVILTTEALKKGSCCEPAAGSVK